MPTAVRKSTKTKKTVVTAVKPAAVKAAAAKVTRSEPAAFQKGQKWRTAHGHAEILHIGKTLVQYRFIKTGMIRGHLEMKSLPNFAEAIRNQKATLVA
jgi:hypothetical protein